MSRSKDPHRPFRRPLALTDRVRALGNRVLALGNRLLALTGRVLALGNRVLDLTDRARTLMEKPRGQSMRGSGRSPLLLAPWGPPDACFGSLSEAERLRLARIAIERDARDVTSESG